ncbi:MAG: LysR family transcriptional regulator [Thiolinea sp.]
MNNPNRLRNLDLSTLRSFVTIAESGSMTRAATRLFMTQSAISMQIKRLETSLGLNVFERSAQGMRPTTAGEQLLHFARQMLELNDEAWGRLTSPDYEGQVRLGVPADILYPHIPGVLKAFSRDYPRVQVKLATERTSILKQQFQNGEHDVMLTTEVQPDSDGNIISKQSLAWIGAHNGVAWKKRPLPLGFTNNCAFRRSTLEALNKAGIDWVDMVSTDDEMVTVAMITADLCVGVEMEFTDHPHRVVVEDNGQLPELTEFSIALYCADAQGNHLARELAEYITHAYG